MVLPNSDSDGTLLSCGGRAEADPRKAAVDGNPIEVAQPSSSPMSPKLVETCLLLPHDETSAPAAAASPQHYSRRGLWLPKRMTSAEDDDNDDNYDDMNCPDLGKNESCPLDEYLASLPAIQESRSALLGSSCRQQQQPPPVVRYDGGCLDTRILYVGQREVGHAVPSQADVILSDRATTCHILILRSSTCCGNQDPLVTCAHLDAPRYDACLRTIFQRHASHHRKHMDDDDDEEEEEEEDSHQQVVQMDIHVVGGFLDSKGRSRDLSCWLVYRLAELAAEFQSTMNCTLRTCVVTSLNHYDTNRSNHSSSRYHRSTTAAPLVRGLACRLDTGSVYVARCDAMAIMGPDITLRQARLWSQTHSEELIMVHDNSSSSQFVIEPFQLVPYVNIPRLLSLRNDADLLLQSSTSPDCEEDDYCESVRLALSLFLRYRTHQVFPNWQPRVYQRRQQLKHPSSLDGAAAAAPIPQQPWALVVQSHPPPTTTTRRQHSRTVTSNNNHTGWFQRDKQQPKPGARTKRSRNARNRWQLFMGLVGSKYRPRKAKEHGNTTPLKQPSIAEESERID